MQQTGAAVGGKGTSATLDVNVLIVLTYHRGIPTIQARTQNLGIYIVVATEEERTTDETMAYVFGRSPENQHSQTTESDRESTGDVEDPIINRRVDSQLSDTMEL